MAKRPNLQPALRALVRDICERVEAFGHIHPARILIVAGEARRSSRGSMKPLAFRGGKMKDLHGRVKPDVRVHGRRMLYCMTLRPLFFRASTPQARVATVIHELFHISKKFDGTLSRGRRHDVLGANFSKKLSPLIREYLSNCPAEILAPFAYDGEVRVLKWLERPGAFFFAAEKSRARRLYSEDQLYLGIERMITGEPALADSSPSLSSSKSGKVGKLGKVEKVAKKTRRASSPVSSE